MLRLGSSVGMLLRRSSRCPSVRRWASTSSAQLGDSIRDLMAKSAQPVAVVLVQLPDRGGLHGATLSSFTTLSLSPPLVAFSLKTPSRTADALLASQSSEAPHFTLSILSARQADLAAQLAKPGLKAYIKDSASSSHPLAKVELAPSAAAGVPRVPGLGSMACSLVGRLRLGDSDQDTHAAVKAAQSLSLDQRLALGAHGDPAQAGKPEGESWLLIARIWEVEGAQEAQGGEGPLLYCNRRFASIKEE